MTAFVGDVNNVKMGEDYSEQGYNLLIQQTQSS